MLEMQQTCDEAILQAAKQICMAAVTAPKACGRDSVTCGVLVGEEIRQLTGKMVRMEQEIPNCRPIFIRDAELVAQCPAVVLLGSKRQSRGLTPCGLCGHENCGACHAAGGHCAFDDMDLGIAIGSACAMAADLRVDNRVLYTAGMAAMELKLLGEDVTTIMALPLSATNQNIFFIRQKNVCTPEGK